MNQVKVRGNPQRVYDILLVDDEPEVLDALTMTLKRARNFQCNIKAFSNPQDAMRELETKTFDMVLADYRMPHMTGVELLKAVHQKHPRTVRALITGYTDVEIAMEAMDQAKIHYYVQKPWNNDELRLTVYEALSGTAQPAPGGEQATKAPEGGA